MTRREKKKVKKMDITRLHACEKKTRGRVETAYDTGRCGGAIHSLPVCLHICECVSEMEKSQNSWVVASNVLRIFENENSLIIAWTVIDWFAVTWPRRRTGRVFLDVNYFKDITFQLQMHHRYRILLPIHCHHRISWTCKSNKIAPYSRHSAEFHFH